MESVGGMISFVCDQIKPPDKKYVVLTVLANDVFYEERKKWFRYHLLSANGRFPGSKTVTD